MATQIEFYDALKEPIGEEKAKLVAEAIVATSDLATKVAMEAGFARLEKQIADVRADTRQWMLTFFVPLWLGVYGTLAAVVVSVVQK